MNKTSFFLICGAILAILTCSSANADENSVLAALQKLKASGESGVRKDDFSRLIWKAQKELDIYANTHGITKKGCPKSVSAEGQEIVPSECVWDPNKGDAPKQIRFWQNANDCLISYRVALRFTNELGNNSSVPDSKKRQWIGDSLRYATWMLDNARRCKEKIDAEEKGK